jgi:ADP-ribose pyrophosphatase YjhB (NUDIX family)
MEDKEYYKTLPKKNMGAGALFFNEAGEMLIVKPNYKDYWSTPGGVVEENESPKDACIREIKEEIGIEKSDLEFLCVDYVSAKGERNENLQFVFYGGILSEEEIKRISINKNELEEARFAKKEDVMNMIGERLKRRLPNCLKAIENKRAFY